MKRSRLCLCLLSLALLPLAGGCSTFKVDDLIHETQISLFVPESLQRSEDLADQVTVLLATGNAPTFENAVVHLVDGQILVDRGANTPVLGTFALADVRAVQLFRSTTRAAPPPPSRPLSVF